ncbi:hypothetical protein CHY08_31150 (plasmid) [Rhizobium leguminosarum bv. viciae]|uniref:LssY C-terminal domain-containing protein n=1 Tax=Rhizobium leguminosarum TaxID=384 RepID=UPI000B8CDF0A|nr:LssY C-terminal domain-containing protein [Rhizobium leguminosarum]ASR11520.1 hypothetical protein CHY08_31150 [Rhizobium leguminosarum bv. viciae]NKN03144.1 hypothetical protein [Rhizobium leguminosarum bv. viciae]
MEQGRSSRGRWKSAAGVLAAVLLAYLLVCYLVMPELWIFRDRSTVADLSRMVTTTDDDIPGDPINVGVVGPLFFDGRKQDLAFEKPVGRSADERHHIRLWRTATVGADGQPLWLGSASFDRGVGVSHDTGQITHHIGPDLDAERELVIGDLKAAGQISMTYERAGVGATKDGRNGGGDPYFTDGRILVGVLRSAEKQ